MTEHDPEVQQKLHVILHEMACEASDAHLQRRRFTHKDWAAMIEQAKKRVLTLFPAQEKTPEIK